MAYETNSPPPDLPPTPHPLNPPPTTGVGGMVTESRRSFDAGSFEPRVEAYRGDPRRTLPFPNTLVPALKREDIDSSALAALTSPSRENSSPFQPTRDPKQYGIPSFSELDSVSRLGPRYPPVGTSHTLGMMGGFSSGRGYSCALCPQTFGRKNSLRRHEKLHSGEKPYRCDQCNKSFSRRDILLRHATSRKCQALKIKSHSPRESPHRWQDDPEDPVSK